MKIIYETKHLIVFLCLFFICNIYAQENQETIYIQHDSIAGLNYLDVYNGTVHFNKDITLKGEHRYLYTNFKSTTVNYDGEKYFHIQTKYDLVNDVLTILPYKSTSNVSINAITDKVASFYINELNRNFVNLDVLAVEGSAHGFYEKLTENKELELYTKFIKKPRDIIKNNRSLITYNLSETYYVVYKNTLHEVESASSFIDLFPSKKDLIKNFFKENKKLRKNNLPDFLSRLTKQLDQSL
ncbi:hypothetical protein [Neptunitalea lumnitzerae]|uniref:DUF4369 domain-containing protein n=1 Tax=Neptunitalea lumnitzerae TaxID=2965509 RepID=A0ABQ5MMF3_9FLAO|nr:hypothetical protein [Neptunitalea sp. Y10]GLB50554.1 hypothetical protein Y10_29220 [Neptunitalea sp. Y10]